MQLPLNVIRSAESEQPAALCVDEPLSFVPLSPVQVEWAAVDLGDLAFEPLKALPVKITSTSPKAIGFQFPEGTTANWLKGNRQGATTEPPSAGQDCDEQAAAADGRPSGEAAAAKPRPKLTRIRPPGDLVKLEDRLYYLLQPPLEQLVQGARLEFPFQPFPYQFEGISFLFPRAAAILADEMGLGKTMQAITTIRMLLLSGELGRVLLVCPKPLVTNWMKEFRQWAPEIPVAVVEGDASRRRWIWTDSGSPVTLANYESLVRDADYLADQQLHFDLMALDEAQRIKNRNSTTSQVVRSVPRNRSWALTGTPIENSPDDLVSIFEFLSPGYLQDGMPLRSMADATQDYILRRTKDKVLTEMPPKMYRDADLELTPAQWAAYKAAEDDGLIHLDEMGDALTIQHVFELVLRLKQICNFDPISGASCKLERLEADMEEVAASGQKAILFSQWVETLEVLADRLARFKPLQYHGRIPHQRRDGVISQFREDPDCHLILMSYGAGSVGLNLQFCQYVFLFDRWWNPAVEDQAINRAHRIGAAGPVTVTRMIATNTIEQRIHNVLEEKRQLSELLFSTTGTPAGLGLSQKEIFGLFQLTPPKAAAAA